LLQHLDGTCGLDDLEARVVDHVAAGELKFLRDGAEVVDPAAVRECAAEHARHALETLLGQACLASV